MVYRWLDDCSGLVRICSTKAGPRHLKPCSCALSGKFGLLKAFSERLQRLIFQHICETFSLDDATESHESVVVSWRDPRQKAYCCSTPLYPQCVYVLQVQIAACASASTTATQGDAQSEAGASKVPTTCSVSLDASLEHVVSENAAQQRAVEECLNDTRDVDGSDGTVFVSALPVQQVSEADKTGEAEEKGQEEDKEEDKDTLCSSCGGPTVATQVRIAI